MDNSEITDRITILDHCHCIVCDKPIMGRRRRHRRIATEEGVEETHLRITHSLCRRIYDRLQGAEARLERAKRDILDWEFALFMVRER
jgi:hypothetical protein